MKKDKPKNMKEFVFSWEILPAFITFLSSEGRREYVLKTNKEKTTLQLNKREY
jgi:hypothetical protein